MRRHATVQWLPASHGPLAQNLEAIRKVVHRVHDRILVAQSLPLLIRKHPSEPLLERIPFRIAPNIVGHKESAAVDEVAKLRGLFRRKIPITHAPRIEE